MNDAIKRILNAYNTEKEILAKKENRDPLIIPHFSCHHLRHKFCTRYCENEATNKLQIYILWQSMIELDVFFM